MAKKPESADGNILADVEIEATVEKSVLDPGPDPGEELVEYTAPLGSDPEHSAPIFVAVNGESIRIQRGATVWIKRKFVEVLEHARDQELAAYRARMRAQTSGGPMANL